ncbi:IS630 family transposase [Enhygromyxa salina]|nr:IS630 family transposase [Enhygromyxa salina]
MQISTRVGRPPTHVEPTAEDLKVLERWARGRTVSVQLAQRARVVLLCAQGMGTTEVSKKVGLSAATVSKWRKRFAKQGTDGLHDLPRPKTARKLSDEKVEEVLRSTLETTPKGQTHWSTRQLAKKLGVSQSSVSRIWRAFSLKPHRQETFRLSTDDFFVEKVRDVVGLYMSPPDNALVLCVDEKSQIQALERGQPVIPMLFGQPERQTPQYLRHGTTTLFAALNIATGEVIGECHSRHRAIEFRKFLNTINRSVPEELEVHVILDNYATHSAPEIQRWLKRHRRFHFHFVPTYSSWLNQVERWFGLLTQQALRRGVHRSTAELEQAIREYIAAHNADPKPFIWTKTADQIIAAVARHCQRLQEVFGEG